jgi:hypothetical protein
MIHTLSSVLLLLREGGGCLLLAKELSLRVAHRSHLLMAARVLSVQEERVAAYAQFQR